MVLFSDPQMGVCEECIGPFYSDTYNYCDLCKLEFCEECINFCELCDECFCVDCYDKHTRQCIYCERVLCIYEHKIICENDD